MKQDKVTPSTQEESQSVIIDQLRIELAKSKDELRRYNYFISYIHHFRFPSLALSFAYFHWRWRSHHPRQEQYLYPGYLKFGVISDANALCSNVKSRVDDSYVCDECLFVHRWKPESFIDHKRIVDGMSKRTWGNVRHCSASYFGRISLENDPDILATLYLKLSDMAHEELKKYDPDGMSLKVVAELLGEKIA
jgi:hypothetical protein